MNHAAPRAVSVPSGMSRRTLLQAGLLGVGAPLSTAVAQSPSRRRDTAVIFLWMCGGPSHLDTLDMKPSAPSEIRSSFGSIRTSLPGLEICEWMPGHARVAQRLAVVRSLQHTQFIHEPAHHWIQTSAPLVAVEPFTQTHPAVGAVAAYSRRAGRSGMPAYVCLPKPFPQQGAVSLGARFNAFIAGDPSLPGYQTPELSLPREVSLERLQKRSSLLSELELLRHGRSGGDLDSMDQFRRQAFDLVTSLEARAAFELEREPAGLRDKYGRHFYGQGMLLARRLVEAGVTFVTVNLGEKELGSWDDHGDVEKKLRRRLPVFDQAFAALVEDLSDRGLSERVLVVATGEFGREPRIDKSNAGRNHWPHAMTAVLSGGGIREGQVVGATTSDGAWVSRSPYAPGDLLATIYHVLGIHPGEMLPTRDGRPLPILESGRPIKELF